MVGFGRTQPPCNAGRTVKASAEKKMLKAAATIAARILRNKEKYQSALPLKERNLLRLLVSLGGVYPSLARPPFPYSPWKRDSLGARDNLGDTPPNLSPMND